MSEKDMTKFKSDLKSGLIAIAMAAVGGLMLVGAAALYLLPVLNGEEPNLISALALGILGAIIEFVGDWKLMMMKFRKMDERIAAIKNRAA